MNDAPVKVKDEGISFTNCNFYLIFLVSLRANVIKIKYIIHKLLGQNCLVKTAYINLVEGLSPGSALVGFMKMFCISSGQSKKKDDLSTSDCLFGRPLR